MKFTHLLRTAIAAGLIILLAASAQAASIKLTYSGNLGSEGAPTGWISGVNSKIYAGEFDFSTSENTTGMIEWDDSLSAFCVQIETYLKTSTTEYDATNGLGIFEGTQTGLMIDRLFSSYYETSQENTQTSAAMQLALWEIINEEANTLSLSDDVFQSTYFSGARSLANNWLSSLDETSATGKYLFHSLTADNSQNLLTVTKANMPEPGTLLLLSTGLFALFRARRKLR